MGLAQVAQRSVHVQKCTAFVQSCASSVSKCMSGILERQLLQLVKAWHLRGISILPMFIKLGALVTAS